MLAFDDRPLVEIVGGANRYAPSKIVLTDPDLGALRYTISFPAKDPLGWRGHCQRPSSWLSRGTAVAIFSLLIENRRKK
jgi:hypothetical protein